MLNTKKLVDWLGVTFFECWMFTFFLIITLVLLVCKLDGIVTSLTWFNVLLPLFISDTLAGYFCLIVFIRQYIHGYVMSAVYRAFYSFSQLFLLVSFKVCLLYKLDGKKIDNSDIFIYVGALNVALLTRLCIMKH